MSAAGIVTVNEAPVSKIVSRRVDPAKATELPANPEPVSCTARDVVWTGEEGGTTPFKTGTEAVTENKAPSTVVESGGGFSTLIRKSPDLLMNSSGIVPVNPVAEPKVVARGVPAKRILEAGRKFVPVTLMGIVAAPAVADPGEKPVIVGGEDTTLTTNDAAPPPGTGLTIEPLRMPGCVSCDAGTEN